MAKRVPVVGGNWKCNGKIETVKQLVNTLNEAAFDEKVEVIVSPPFVYFDFVKTTLAPPTQIAAQNFWLSNGAFTGEISAEMLVDVGVNSVIIGHSERRTIFNESDELVAKKVKKALDLNLQSIVCIGETLQQREENQTANVIVSQLSAFTPEVKDWSKVIIAYEPVWAIGTGKVATPEQAQEVHALIRSWLSTNVSQEVADKTRIIYGGSVKKDNAGTLASMEDIDGFLVGGASLLPEFIDIVKSLNSKY